MSTNCHTWNYSIKFVKLTRKLLNISEWCCDLTRFSVHFYIVIYQVSKQFGAKNLAILPWFCHRKTNQSMLLPCLPWNSGLTKFHKIFSKIIDFLVCFGLDKKISKIKNPSSKNLEMKKIVKLTKRNVILKRQCLFQFDEFKLEKYFDLNYGMLILLDSIVWCVFSAPNIS